MSVLQIIGYATTALLVLGVSCVIAYYAGVDNERDRKKKGTKNGTHV